MSDVTLTAVLDDKVLGEGRYHFIFPSVPAGVKKALVPPIAGGVWISRDFPIPDTIIIKLKKGE